MIVIQQEIKNTLDHLKNNSDFLRNITKKYGLAYIEIKYTGDEARISVKAGDSDGEVFYFVPSVIIDEIELAVCEFLDSEFDLKLFESKEEWFEYMTMAADVQVAN